VPRIPTFPWNCSYPLAVPTSSLATTLIPDTTSLAGYYPYYFQIIKSHLLLTRSN